MNAVKKHKQQELFPWVFILYGIMICLISHLSKVVVYDIENPELTYLCIMMVSFIIGYIPVKIAYEKQIKHRRGIYILSVIAMSIASPIISIAAIILAYCDKKNCPATAVNTQCKNAKKKTAVYGWEDWD